MPIASMTSYGFGEASGRDDGYSYSCEIRTLNSRFLEVNVRMPRHLIALEADLIGRTKATLHRGKVDLFLDISRDGQGSELPKLDEKAVKHYAELFDQLTSVLQDNLASSFASLQDPSAADFFRMDGVLISPEKSQTRGPEAADTHKSGIFAAVDAALAAVIKAREKEGSALKGALLDLISSIEAERTIVAEKRDDILATLQQNYRRKLEAAVANMLKVDGGSAAGEIPDERILSEVALLADKADVDEELTRLQTHCAEFTKLLEAGGQLGRKLDFLCQEMHREVNTMSNKLTQTDVSQHTLNMKQTVERIRQQVQNIE